jgi:hypothetical protein
MAKVEEIYIKGKLKWFSANRLDKFGKWSTIVYPDTESLEKIRELQAEGVKNTIKKDEDGYFVRFTRPPTIDKFIHGIGKQKVALEAPKVVGKDGIPIEELIGNGSDGTLKIEVYEHGTPPAPGSSKPGKAKAVRWMAARIDNLVPYTPASRTPSDQKALSGLDEQPEPMF